MRNQVTVVPGDGLILIDGVGLRLALEAEEGVHAIQWRDGKGSVEYNSGRRSDDIQGEDGYARYVEPYVALWEEEDARLKAEEAKRPTREDALNMLTERRKAAEYGGFILDGRRWDSGLKDEQRLLTMLSVLDKQETEYFAGWKTGPDTYVDLTMELASRAVIAMMGHYDACFQVEKEKKARLEQDDPDAGATLRAWLEANLDAGWPGA